LFFERSSDGRLLIASSSDGYCSIINFQEGQLGNIYKVTAENDREEKKEVKEDTDEKSSPAPFIELDVNAVDMDISRPKNNGNNTNEKNYTFVEKETHRMEVENDEDVPDTEETEDFQLVLEDTIADNVKPNVKATPPKTDKPPTMISARTPRRVQLITLSSPKRTKTE
jgi:chromatin assembly factor 1 subunit B